VPGIGQAPSLSAAVFAQTRAGAVPQAPVEEGDTWYVFRVKSRERADISKPDPNELKSLRERLIGRKQGELYAQWVEGLRKKAKIVENEQVLSYETGPGHEAFSPTTSRAGKQTLQIKRRAQPSTPRFLGGSMELGTRRQDTEGREHRLAEVWRSAGGGGVSSGTMGERCAVSKRRVAAARAGVRARAGASSWCRERVAGDGEVVRRSMPASAGGRGAHRPPRGRRMTWLASNVPASDAAQPRSWCAGCATAARFRQGGQPTPAAGRRAGGAPLPASVVPLREPGTGDHPGLPALLEALRKAAPGQQAFGERLQEAWSAYSLRRNSSPSSRERRVAASTAFISHVAQAARFKRVQARDGCAPGW